MLALTVGLMCAPAARGTITVIDHWRLGENDPGAVSGGAATNAIDIVGTNNLKFQGTARYTNDVDPQASLNAQSFLAANLSPGNAYATNQIVSTLVNNFGIECWVKPLDNTTGQIIVYNGSTANSGWGITTDGPHFVGLFGGVQTIGPVPLTTNAWTHVALVRSNGLTTLYTNGVSAATSGSTPHVPAGNFAIGAPPQVQASQFFKGLVDEVRVFTFVPDQFSPGDLAFANPILQAVTGNASSVALSTAVLNGTVKTANLNTTTWFQWGIDTDYGQVTAVKSVNSTNSILSVSNSLIGLSIGTTYHFRLVATNLLGTNFGGDMTFTTLGPPGATTGNANQFTADSAVLNGTVLTKGLNSTYWFLWGATTNYDHITDVASLSDSPDAQAVSSLISGLTPGSTYHFQLVATNNLGIRAGSDQAFRLPMFQNSGIALPGVGPVGIFPPGLLNSIAWGDYDNDGRLDLLISGNDITEIWRNNADGTFTNINAGLPGLHNSSVAWGDFDNDGRLDVLISGTPPGFSSVPTTQLWHNNGNGAFSATSSFLYAGLISVVDYNHDGFLDISGVGSSIFTLGKGLYRNNRNGTFTLMDIGLNGNGSTASYVAWGDYDNDGLPDLLVMGYSNSSLTQIWHNNGDNTFSNINVALPALVAPWGEWGDYDNDGRLDILITGGTTNFVAQVWHNDGSNIFSRINFDPPPDFGVFAALGPASWGDFDNDGYLDILLPGSVSIPFVSTAYFTQVWRNNGNGSFSNINETLPGFADSQGSVLWADYDNDGRLDILIQGKPGVGGNFTQIYRNLTSKTNTPPAIPPGLTTSFTGSKLTFSWNASADSETPAADLTYNLRVGHTPGGSDVFLGMSTPSGSRQVPMAGNMKQRQFIVGETNLGVSYYWTVQAVDGVYRGSAFAPEQSIKTLLGVGPVSATNIVAGDANGDGVVDQNELANVLSHLGNNVTVDPSTLNLVLSNYFAGAAPSLFMTNVVGLGSSNVNFGLSNSPESIFSVQYSTNLTDWLPLGPAILNYHFTDTNAPGEPIRYYRLNYP